MNGEFNGFSYPIPQSRYEEEIFNANLEVQKANAKDDYSNLGKLRTEIAMETLREQNSEKRKQQYEELMLNDSGDLIVTTRNLSIYAVPRRVCNFTHTEVIRLRNGKSPESYYLFLCEILGKQKMTYLAETKVGKITYLIRKLRSIGCEIYAKNARTEELYVGKIWSWLLQRCTEEIEIPSALGWQETQNGELIFVKEENLTWEKVMLLAK